MSFLIGVPIGIGCAIAPFAGIWIISEITGLASHLIWLARRRRTS